MLWFHVVRLVSASMYTCVNSLYCENYILIQAADWAKQENRIRLVVWNRSSLDSKERQEVALTIAFYKDGFFFLSHSDHVHVTTSNTELQWRMSWHIKPHLHNIIDEYPENQCSKKCRFACINNCHQEVFWATSSLFEKGIGVDKRNLNSITKRTLLSTTKWGDLRCLSWNSYFIVLEGQLENVLSSFNPWRFWMDANMSPNLSFFLNYWYVQHPFCYMAYVGPKHMTFHW